MGKESTKEDEAAFPGIVRRWWPVMATNTSRIADRSRLVPFRHLPLIAATSSAQVAMLIRLATPRPKNALDW